jgi:small subunit ribosomal protein S20
VPITKSAKIALRKSSKKRKFNIEKKIVLKKAKKDLLKLLEMGKIEEAKKMLPRVYKLLDKAVKINLIKKNKAARDKSRLAKRITKK